uniref:STARD3 N-terminal like n=1 Tax=Oryzias latipes TaxID=8090 RepID=A0A3B3HJ82_ORYLA
MERSIDSRLTAKGMGSVSSMVASARLESYEAADKKCISDVRRTFCLFVTFDLLFITMLWIIELNVNGSIETQLEKEVLHYDYHASFFDIFVRFCSFSNKYVFHINKLYIFFFLSFQLLAVFRFSALILSYAICKLRHWWAIAITTAVSCAFLIVKVILSKLLTQGAFGYLLPIVSFVLAWIETWLLDFKVLPQEAEDEIRYQPFVDSVDRTPVMGPGPLSDRQTEGQFYSPPESLADSDEDLEDKHDPEKGLIHQVT